MKRIAYTLIAFLLLSFSSPLTNASTLDAKGKKTVSVKSYKTKKGKTVKAHKRSNPSRK